MRVPISVTINNMNKLLGVPNSYTQADSAIKSSIHHLRMKLDIDETNENWHIAQAENPAIRAFLGELHNHLSAIAMYTLLAPYDAKYDIKLSNIHFLGFEKNVALGAFKSLAIKVCKNNIDDLMNQFIVQLNTIEDSLEKSLIIIIAILKQLKLDEAVAICSSPFIIGGKI